MTIFFMDAGEDRPLWFPSMKTPTLIVRLIGIYLALKSCWGLLVMATVQRSVSFNVPGVGASSAYARTEWLLVLLMLLIGIFITWHAGTLARILTFDAEPDIDPGRRRELDADEAE